MATPITDEQIKKVLEQIVDLTPKIKDSPTYSIFHMKNYPAAQRNDAKDNDIHMDMILYANAVCKTMGEIENKNVPKMLANEREARKYAEALEDVVNIFENDTGRVYPQNDIVFKGFVEDSSNQSIKFLTHGLGEINVTDKFLLTKDPIKTTTYTKIIYYLFNYISMLDDLDNVNGYTIINFLKKEDMNNLCPLIAQLRADIMKNDNYSSIDSEKIDNSIWDSLSAVSDKIIAKIKSLSTKSLTSKASTYLSKTETVKNTSANWDWDAKGFDGMLTNLGIDGVIVAAVAAAAKKLKDLNKPGGGYSGYNSVADPKVAIRDMIVNKKHIDRTLDELDPAIYADRDCSRYGGAAGSMTKTEIRGDFDKNIKNQGTYTGAHPLLRTGVLKAVNSGDFTAYDAACKAIGFPPRTGSGVSGYPAATFLYTPNKTSGSKHGRFDKAELYDTTTTSANANGNIINAFIAEIEKIVPGSTPDPSDILYQKGILYAFLLYALDSDKDFTTIGVGGGTLLGQGCKDDLSLKIETMIRNLSMFETRMHYLHGVYTKPNKIFKDNPGIRDAFVSGFIWGFKGQIADDSGKLFAPKEKVRTKNLSSLKESFNFIKSNANFFKQIFNIIKLKADNTEESPLSDDKWDEVNAGNLSNYALNLKKGTKRPQSLAGLATMTGGGKYDFDPIFFTELFPAFDIMSSFGRIQMPDKGFIEHSTIDGSPYFVANIIARSIYNTTDPTVDIEGITLNIADAFAKTATRGFKPYVDFMKYITNKGGLMKLKSFASALKPQADWEQVDKNLTDELMKGDDKWYREGNTMYLRDTTTGKNKDHPGAEESCAFVDSKCEEFLNCIDAGNKAECKKFLYDQSYRPVIDQAIGEIAKKVKRVDPFKAFTFLAHIGFGKIREQVQLKNKRGIMNTYKVESVASWLANLENRKDRFGNEFDQINNFLSKDKNSDRAERSRVLKYLEILVAWVNANPQILNQEETLDQSKQNIHEGKEAKGFEIYRYKAHPSSYGSEAKKTCDALTRIKIGLDNDMMGFSGRGLSSSIMNMPNFEMPLARTIAFPKMKLNMPFMVGGAGEFERSINDMTAGSKIFEDIFNNLLGIMDEGKYLKENGGRFRVKLKEESKNHIEKNLVTLKEAEKVIKENMVQLARGEALYRRSGGQIDLKQVSYGEEDAAAMREARKIVLEKHNNLLALTGAYNRRASEMSNTLKTIADIIVKKAEKSGADNYDPLDKYINH